MTFDPSNDLSAEARALLDAAGDGDAPTQADRARIRAGVARRLALGVAAGAVVATTAKSVVAGTSATSGVLAGASTGAAVAGAGATTSVVGGTVAAGASAAATGTAVAAGGTALAGSALTFGLAGAGGKILAAIALVSVVGAGTVTYRQVRSNERAPATTSTAAAQAIDRSDILGTAPSHRASPAPAIVPIDGPSSIGGPAPLEGPARLATGAAPSVASAPATPVAPRAPAAPRGEGDRSAASKGGASGDAIDANAAASGASVAPASGGDSAGDLVAELALLRDAHAALRDGDGTRALALLADHARRFPSGALTEEREASRVLALCKVGRVDEARDVAGRFLREHPRSPQAARVAHACDEDTTF